MRRFFLLPLLTATSAAFAEPAPQPVPVSALAAAPGIDGDLRDWGTDGWLKIPVKPAVDKAERSKLGLEGEDRNATGQITVQLKAGVAKGRFYLAVRWPDDAPDTESKGWEWRGEKYIEGKKREDMFAVRFHLAGNFERTMLSTKDYKVDVWLWSAARTNPAGLAEDMMHTISGRPVEDAAEYEVPGKGTVYIKKVRDEGSAPYRNVRAPKTKEADRLPSFELTGQASGSAADVAAKGVWKAGYWNLEFSRKLDTGNADDVAFHPGQRLLGQIAVFNKGYAEHKSVSEPLMFDFTAIK